MSPEYRTPLHLLNLDEATPAQREAIVNSSPGMPEPPNMYRAMGNAPALLDTYRLGYTRLRTESGFTPQEQEVLFLTVSVANQCHYCVAAHSFIADTSSRVPREATEAIRGGVAPADARLAALHTFVLHMMETHGRPTEEAVHAFIDAGFSHEQVLYVVLGIAVKTLSNYTNHIFETPIDSRFERRS